MVTEKKPSIYSDRSTIGSTDELDEYGVWVKSGPQDLPVDIVGEEFADLSMPDFDTDFGDESPDSDMSPRTLPDSFADGAGENPDLEVMDLQIPDIDFSVTEAEAAIADADVPAEDEFDTNFEDLSIPEEEPADEYAEDFNGEPFAEEPMGDFTEEPEEPMEAFIEEPFDDENPEDMGPELEDVPGGWDTEESSDEMPAGESLALEEDIPAESEPAVKAEDTSPDLSTRLLMKIADELASIRNELSALKQDFALVRAEAPAEEKAEAPQHGGFFSGEDDEKIALTGDELDNILNTADFTEEGGKIGEHDIDISLSEDPEDDLSLREKKEGEISFTDVADDPGADLGAEEPAVEDAETGEPGASGFEDGEEEIDIDFDDLGIDINISPDDFDMAEEEKAGTEKSLADMALDLATEEFSIDDLAVPGEESPIEENLMVEENLMDENRPEEDLFIEEGNPEAIDMGGEAEDSEVLRNLRSFGVEAMEPPPDEIAYLEDDPLAAEMAEDVFDGDISLDGDENFDAASLDLSGAVIDEPDLSAGITENPVNEPSLDDISLDGIEDINIELEDEQLEGAAEESMYEEPELPVPEKAEENETLEVSLADGDDSLAQIIPEGFEAGVEETPVSFDDDLETAFADDAVIDVPAESIGPAFETSAEAAAEPAGEDLDIPSGLKNELKTVLSYMDHLLESLPEEKIEEFAKSEYFDAYRKLFKELGLV
ncbi:MAG: hypothetical protein LBS37_07415 [Treponema sp.]|jgi:hypothetical protein|nr:hypothetical protein [Treponema sp.]